MTRSILRPGHAARAAAVGAVVIALAAGCGGTDQGEDGTAPADDPSASQEGEGFGDDAPADDDATADEATDDAPTDEGAGDSGQQEPAAAALPADADLAAEELPISAEQAIEIATETAGGGDLVQIEIALGEEPGRVSGWDLDSDDGTIRYQVDIDRAEGAGDVDVEVDVETGDVRIDN